MSLEGSFGLLGVLLLGVGVIAFVQARNIGRPATFALPEGDTR